MDHEPAEFSLLELHLDQLDEQERAKLEELLRNNPHLRHRSELLGRTLRPLDFFSVNPPENLPDSVLRYVDERQYIRPSQPTEPVTTQPSDRGRYRFVPARDLLAVAASLLVIASLMVPGLSEFRSRSHRSLCESNMQRIFGGLSTYTETYDRWLPYAGDVVGSHWLPGDSATPLASNSRHLYLLLKTGVGPAPADFVCPSATTGSKMANVDFASRDDFELASNVSYDSVNLSGSNPNARPLANSVYLSDTNPMFVGGRFHDDLEPDSTNSPLHKGRGQTVLQLDGSVTTLTSPVYGLRKDNLWLAGGIRRYNGTETPVRPDDVFLVPGFPKTDPRYSPGH